VQATKVYGFWKIMLRGIVASLARLYRHRRAQLEGQRTLGANHRRISVCRQDQSGPRGAATGCSNRRSFSAPSNRSDGRTDSRSNTDLGRILAFCGVSLTRDSASLNRNVMVANAKLGQPDGNDRFAFDAAARIGVHHTPFYLSTARRDHFAVNHKRFG